MRLSVLATLILVFGMALPALASGGSILGLSEDIDELELYETPDAEDPAHVLGADALAFPTDILDVSDNGMFKLRHNGADYWVITDDVRSDAVRAIDTSCEPQLAGDIVTHGKRGAGEDCE